MRFSFITAGGMTFTRGKIFAAQKATGIKHEFASEACSPSLNNLFGPMPSLVLRGTFARYR